MTVDKKDERSCGGCSVCCKPYPIEEIQKPAETWCQHCDIGRGCRIYETRPPPCVEFKCLWRFGAGGENDRPDRSRVMLDAKSVHDLGETLVVHELRDGAVAKSALAKQTINNAGSRGMPIWIIRSRESDCLYVPESFQITDELLQEMRETRTRLFVYAAGKAGIPIFD